jgi:hypothetical protein
MDRQLTLSSLNSLFTNVSKQLTEELAKRVPDLLMVRDCRKQLGQVDKSIRRLQIQKDIVASGH